MNIPSFSPDQFVLSSYGSGYALGGKPEDLDFVANTLHNYGMRDSEVNLTHEEFGYVVASEPELVRAFSVLNVLREGPITGKRSGFRSFAEARVEYLTLKELELQQEDKADYNAIAFVDAIPREGFLVGQSLRNNAFAAQARSVAVAKSRGGETDHDWLDEAVLTGVRRAQNETHLAH